MLCFSAFPSLALISTLVISWLQDGCCTSRQEDRKRPVDKRSIPDQSACVYQKTKAFLEAPLWNLGYCFLLAVTCRIFNLSSLFKCSFHYMISVTSIFCICFINCMLDSLGKTFNFPFFRIRTSEQICKFVLFLQINIFHLNQVL